MKINCPICHNSINYKIHNFCEYCTNNIGSHYILHHHFCKLRILRIFFPITNMFVYDIVFNVANKCIEVYSIKSLSKPIKSIAFSSQPEKQLKSLISLYKIIT